MIGAGAHGLIAASLERAGDRVPRFERKVFERLDAMRPEFSPLFALDRDWGVRGAMVQTCIDCILDRAAGGDMSRRMIFAERGRHTGYGVPEARFGDLFTAIRDVVREADGADWSPEMDEAWACLLEELDAVGKQGVETRDEHS